MARAFASRYDIMRTHERERETMWNDSPQELVADLRDGLDQLGADLLAQLGDVVIHRARVGDAVGRIAPDVVQELLARHDLAAVADEQAQHLVFLERQRY